MSFSILSAVEIPLAEQALVANRAFAGYIGGWTDLDAAGLARFLSLQGADLYCSRFVQSNTEGLAGFGYINRTGNISRLACMALAPSARGTGAASHLLRHLCDEARARGELGMVLEVIEQNPRAHALYRREGFREKGRLNGWRLTSAEMSAASRKVEQISIAQALNTPTADFYPDQPWSISRFAVAKVPGTRAYRLGEVSIVIADPLVEGPIRVHGIFSATADWPARRDALAATIGQFHGREFFAVPVFPEEFGVKIFQPLGFSREKLSQFLMRRDFQANG